MKGTPRHARGADNPATVLTDDDVDMIRDLYAEDRFKRRAERFWTCQMLAVKFGVSKRYIHEIVHYRVRLAPIDFDR